MFKFIIHKIISAKTITFYGQDSDTGKVLTIHYERSDGDKWTMTEQRNHEYYDPITEGVCLKCIADCNQKSINELSIDDVIDSVFISWKNSIIPVIWIDSNEYPIS